MDNQTDMIEAFTIDPRPRSHSSNAPEVGAIVLTTDLPKGLGVKHCRGVYGIRSFRFHFNRGGDGCFRNHSSFVARSTVRWGSILKLPTFAYSLYSDWV